MRTPILATFLGLALLGACRSDNNTTIDSSTPSNDGKIPTGDGPPSGPVKIQDVQNDSMPPGTAVSLSGVVVTAIDAYGAKTGDIWVEEPAGGPFSGVHVFGAPNATVATLKVGDIVDISGAQKDEFALTSDTSGNTETELEPGPNGMTVTKTGTGTVPTPTVVDALAIGQMATPAARATEWEKWEGVLITVNNVSALSSPSCGSQNPCTDQNEFKITGGAEVESTLAALPTTGIASQACVASVTGVGSYFFQPLILPRATTDVALNGTGCPAAENTAAVCSDTIDNDGNGFADCLDNGCVVAAPACRMTTSITAVQATTPTMPVEIDNVYVTGIAHNGRSFWISTNLQAAPNEGLYVFNSQTLDPAVVVGAKVNVIGKISEFNDDTMGGTLTELAPLQITVVAAPTTPPLPVLGKAASDLLVPATAPTYESVLVTLTNVAITTVGTAANGFVATAKQNGTTFSIGTDIIQLAAADEKCYATITGFWTNLEAGSSGATTKPNAFGFIPMTLGTVGATCN